MEGTIIPHGLWSDVWFGLRRLASAPIFTLFAVISLGLGLGVTTSVYSVIHSLLWQPLAVANAERVAMVVTPSTSRVGVFNWNGLLSARDLAELRESQTTLGTLAASAFIYDALGGANAGAELLRGEAVVGDYFGAIGLPMEAGRPLQPADAEPGGAGVVVLNLRLATRQFGGPTPAIGAVVRIGGQPYDVVGVAPDGFDGLGGSVANWTAYWLPESHRPPSAGGRRPDATERQFAVFGRLSAGGSVAGTAAEVGALAARLDQAFPEQLPEGRPGAGSPSPRVWQVRSMAETLGAPDEMASRFGLLLMGLVGMVLLVACTNLANLTLARGTMRAHEFAIRRSLGASRWRIVRELTLEGALIAVAGGVVAFVITRVLLVYMAIDLPMNNGRSVQLDPRLNVPVLAIAGVSLLASLIVFGLAPALRLTRRDGAADLKGGAAVGLAFRSGPWRLIRWQVAIAVSFFLVASVSVRIVADAALHDSGIDLDRLAVGSVYFDRERGQDAEAARRTVESVLEFARQQPGVEDAAAATGMPFGQTITPSAGLTTPDKPFVAGERQSGAQVLMATPGIFRTLGVEVIRGRPFDARDGAADQVVIVLSERAALDTFGTTDAVNRQLLIRISGRDPTLAATVIGVARDTDVQFLTHRNSGLAYVPLTQAFSPGVTFVARTDGDPASVAAALRLAIRRADPDLGLYQAGAARQILAPGFVMLRIVATLTLALGVLALVLSMVGLYGVLSQFVAQRTREMGLRLALGATAADVARVALRQGARPVVTGLVLGLAFGTLIRAAIRAFSIPIDIVDGVALVLIPIPVLIAAAAACFLPARRASRVDPNVALRDL